MSGRIEILGPALPISVDVRPGSAIDVETPVASVVVEVPAGLPGPPGATDHGALQGLADNDHPQYARHHTYTQVQPSAQWTIAHGLGYRPAVAVVDTAGDECEGDVHHVDLNTCVLTFSAPFAGLARLI